ncbi:MAG: cytochrome P450 [Polyangiaceae bacterium]|jgi:cytochrome P450
MQSHAPTFFDRHVPPSPSLLPAAQALRWIGQPYAFLEDCERQFGDVFTIDFGSQGRYAVFSHPEAIRSILTADFRVLHVGAGNAVLTAILGPGSLLMLEEQRHVRERRLLMPAFHQKTIVRYGEVIQETVLAATAHWSPGCEFVAQELLQDISIDVILRAVFGVRARDTCAELKQGLIALLNDRRLGLGLLARLRDATPHPAMVDFQAQFDRVSQLTKALVAERRASGQGREDDMLSMLLEARDEDGQRRSDDELRDELITLVATGHETTATALAWGLYWIATSPGIEERLRNEISNVAAPPDAKAYAQLQYLDATCKEVLRIYPIVPSVFRQVVQPFSVAGYDFAPGDVLSPSIYLAHHREDVYPNAREFEPDRFIRRAYSPYEYLPFGGGGRRCIGMQFALYEMKVAIVTLLRRYSLAVAPGQQVVPKRRSVTVAPSGGVRMIVKDVL